MITRIIPSLIVACFLAGCGGGGGGGGGSERGRSGSSAPTGVRILHGVIDIAPIDIFSSAEPEEVVQMARFAEPLTYARLNTGPQDLSLRLHGSGFPLAAAPVTVEKNFHYSFLIFGNETGLGLRGALIADDPGEIPEGSAAVRVVHALVGAGGLTGMLANGLISEAFFGGAGPYVFVPAGIQSVSVTRTSDRRSVSNVIHDFSDGRAYTVFVSGELDYFTAVRLLEDS